MSMSESLSQWLDKRGIRFKPEESYILCHDVLKQEGENLDVCINLAYAFERDAIDNETFTSGLCQVTGYNADKLWRVIKGEDNGEEETTPETQPESTADNEGLGDILTEERDSPSNVEPAAY